MRLTLRQLQVFVAIAQTGSTAAAGHSLGLSQSASSAALKELEAHWDCPLFDRIGRGLQLNARGRRLLPQARALLVDAARLEQAMAAPAAGWDLRLAASSTIGNHLLPAPIASLLANYPLSRIDLQIGNTAQVARAVAQGSVDAGLIEGPCPLPQLRMQPWRQDRLLVVASPRLATDTVARLQAARWLLREPGSGTRQVFDEQLLPCLGGSLDHVQLGSTAAIVAAAMAGAGVACLSEWALADALSSGQLRQVAAPLPALARTLWLLELPGRGRNPALDALLGPLDASPSAMDLR